MGKGGLLGCSIERGEGNQLLLLINYNFDSGPFCLTFPILPPTGPGTSRHLVTVESQAYPEQGLHYSGVGMIWGKGQISESRGYGVCFQAERAFIQRV